MLLMLIINVYLVQITIDSHFFDTTIFKRRLLGNYILCFVIYLTVKQTPFIEKQ